jgi:polar amino acid transport system substrate-binding protein
MPRLTTNTALLALTLSTLALAQDSAQQPPEQRIVAVKDAAPFVMQGEDGEWSGLAVELWSRVANETGIDYRFEETDLDGLFDGVESGRYFAGVGATTVTAERERRVDFTHPYYTGGLAIAVPTSGTTGSFFGAMKALITPTFLSGVGSLAVLLLVVGLVVWLVERRKNQGQFGGGVVKGLGNGFWFSAVTMTTVGYGDKAPITLPGKLVALVWMFASIIVISFFTGAIASAFTASALTGGVQGPQDLDTARVGVVNNTAAEERMRTRGISVRTFDTVNTALEELKAGGLDAVVHDDAILSYTVSTDFPRDARMLEGTFAPQPYAFALAPEAEEREQINQTMLTITGATAWSERVEEVLEGEG